MKNKFVRMDLNVNKPESERLPKAYPGDSINWCNLRVYVREKDAATLAQLVKDRQLFPALWTPIPVAVPDPAEVFGGHLQVWWARTRRKLGYKVRRLLRG